MRASCAGRPAAGSSMCIVSLNTPQNLEPRAVVPCRDRHAVTSGLPPPPAARCTAAATAAGTTQTPQAVTLITSLFHCRIQCATGRQARQPSRRQALPPLPWPWPPPPPADNHRLRAHLYARRAAVAQRNVAGSAFLLRAVLQAHAQLWASHSYDLPLGPIPLAPEEDMRADGDVQGRPRRVSAALAHFGRPVEV